MALEQQRRVELAKVRRCSLTGSKPKLKASGTKSLKQKHIIVLSSFAFNFNLRRYTKVSKRYQAMQGFQHSTGREHPGRSARGGSTF